MYYKDVSEVTISGANNIEFGIRNGDTCGANSIPCVDPKLLAQPTQRALPPEAMLDAVNYGLASNSHAIGAGATIPGLT